MSNTLGLTLIGIGIVLIIVFVVVVQYLAKNKPDSKLGKISKKIDAFIERLPEE